MDKNVFTLGDVLNDCRLGRLFSSESRSCVLQMWILNINYGDSIDNRILYGRLLPYYFANNTWSASMDDHNMLFDAGDRKSKINVFRLSVCLNDFLCKDMIQLLLKGDSLASINSQLKFKISEKLNNRFEKTVFGREGKVAIRPVAYLYNRNSYEQNKRISPHGTGGALSAAIVQLDKLDLLKINGCHDPKVIKWVLGKVNEDSGLDFMGIDSERLGEIEFLVCPTLSDYEKDLLYVSNYNEYVEVSLDAQQLSEFDGFQFHLSILNDGLVYYSNCSDAESTKGRIFSCRFNIGQKLGQIVDCINIEIFGFKKKFPRQRYLCCQQKTYYVREINISMNVVENKKAEIKFDWLESTLPFSRVEGAKAILKVSDNHNAIPSVIGGRKSDAWVTSNRELKQLLKRICPPKSDGRFFQKLSQSDRLGRYLFVEWFKSVLGKYPRSQIVIFDPYFESVGLNLLAFCLTSGTSCTVFRTIVREDERGGVAKGKCSILWDKLKIATKNRKLFNRFSLRIFEIKAGILHDRYILIRDEQGIPVEGFHLSNSFQYACKNHPLLITPIPRDVLMDVADYQKELEKLANNSNSKSKVLVKKVVDFPGNVISDSRNYDPWGCMNRNEAGLAFSIWFDQPKLKDLSGDELRECLLHLGLISKNGFEICIDEGLENCQKFIIGLMDNFENVWFVLGDIMAMSHNRDHKFHYIASEGALIENLLKFAQMRFNLGSLDVEGGVEIIEKSYFQAREVDILNSSARLEFIARTGSIKGSVWGDVYMVEILWERRPIEFIRILEGQVDKLLQIEDKGENNGNYALKIVLLTQVVKIMAFSVLIDSIDVVQTRTLLDSRVGLFRWIGINALVKFIRRSNGFDMVDETCANFESIRKIYVLAWIVKMLSVESDCSDLQSQAIERLFVALPHVIDEEHLRLLLKCTNRNLDLCYMDKWIFEKILFPLLENSRLSWDLISKIWINDLLDSVKKSKDCLVFSSTLRGEMINISAFFFANSSILQRNKYFELIKGVFDGHLRGLRKPLAGERRTLKRDNLINGMIWLLCFCMIVRFYQEKEGSADGGILILINELSKEIEYRINMGEWKKIYPDLVDFFDKIEKLSCKMLAEDDVAK